MALCLTQKEIDAPLPERARQATGYSTLGGLVVGYAGGFGGTTATGDGNGNTIITIPGVGYVEIGVDGGVGFVGVGVGAF